MVERTVKLFFGSAGRAGRSGFAPAVAVLIALFAAYEQGVQGLAHRLTGWLVHLVLLFSAACVLSQRLHDRGRSGWWAAPVLLAFALAWPWPVGPLGWLCAAVLALAAVDLAILPGEKTPNRYGPPRG